MESLLYLCKLVLEAIHSWYRISVPGKGKKPAMRDIVSASHGVPTKGSSVHSRARHTKPMFLQADGLTLDLVLPAMHGADLMTFWYMQFIAFLEAANIR